MGEYFAEEWICQCKDVPVAEMVAQVTEANQRRDGSHLFNDVLDLLGAIIGSWRSKKKDERIVDMAEAIIKANFYPKLVECARAVVEIAMFSSRDFASLLLQSKDHWASYVAAFGGPNLVQQFFTDDDSDSCEAVYQAAAEYGNLEVIRWLFETRGHSPSDILDKAFAGTEDVIRFLLERGADPNFAFSEYACTGHMRFMKVALELRSDLIRAETLVNALNQWTFKIFLNDDEQISVVELLLGELERRASSSLLSHEECESILSALAEGLEFIAQLDHDNLEAQTERLMALIQGKLQ